MSATVVYMVCVPDDVTVEARQFQPGSLYGISVNGEYIGYNLDKREAEMMLKGAMLALERVGLTVKTNLSGMLFTVGEIIEPNQDELDQHYRDMEDILIVERPERAGAFRQHYEEGGN